MKLKLANDKDVAVLEVLEEVSTENVSIIRAGITKLLNSGRTKVILNLAESQKISLDTIKEVIKLHSLAAELKGHIILVGQGNLIRQAMKTFASPPGIKYFDTREAAMSAMGESETEVAAPDYSAGGDPNGRLKQQVAKLELENKALKAKAGQLKTDEARKLRFENGIFQNQLTALEEQLTSIKRERKRPFEMESIEAKSQLLKEGLSNFLKGEGLLPKD